MATKPKDGEPTAEPGEFDLRAALAKIERRIAENDTKAALLEISAQLNRIETLLLDLRQDVPRLVAQVPTALKADEVESLLAETPSVRLIALNHHISSGLRPGDAFEPRERFDNTARMVSLIRGGHLRVSRAA